MVKSEMLSKHPIDPQDPSTFVLHELFTKFFSMCQDAHL